MDARRRERNIAFVHPHTRVLHRSIKPARFSVSANNKKCISRVQKTLWVASVLAATSLCTWQLLVCFQKFFAEPVGTVVRVEWIKQYTFPGLTLCPGETMGVVVDKLCKEHKKCKSLTNVDQFNFPFNEMDISLLDLLQPNMTIKTDRICDSAVNGTECISSDWIQHNIVNTTAGSCHTFKTNLKWHYSGKSWVFWIKITNSSHMPLEAFEVGLYTSTSPSLMFASRANIYRDLFNDLETSVTEFEYLNTTRNPCVSEEEAFQCTEKLIKKHIQTLETNCRLPCMNSTLPLCNSMSEVNDMNTKILQLQFSSNFSNSCSRPCFVTAYSLTRLSDPIEDGDENGTYINLSLKSPSRLIVSEYLTYPLSSLVSDVGGNIGLFLGYSLLSSCEFLINFLKQKH